MHTSRRRRPSRRARSGESGRPGSGPAAPTSPAPARQRTSATSRSEPRADRDRDHHIGRRTVAPPGLHHQPSGCEIVDRRLALPVERLQRAELGHGASAHRDDDSLPGLGPAYRRRQVGSKLSHIHVHMCTHPGLPRQGRERHDPPHELRLLRGAGRAPQHRPPVPRGQVARVRGPRADGDRERATTTPSGRRWPSSSGLQSLIIPEEFGGSGYGYVELIVVLEEMGRALLCAPYFSTVVLAANTLLHVG